MTLQLSVASRNALLDAIETAIGAAAILKIRTGSPPATTSDADTGSVLSTVNLPSDWMAAAASGVKAKTGTWQDSSADASGTAGHFRIYASDGTTCHIQGTVATTGGDMTVDSTTFVSGQTFTVTEFQLTAPNP